MNASTPNDDLATLDRLLADKNMTLEEAEAVGRVKAAAWRWQEQLSNCVAVTRTIRSPTDSPARIMSDYDRTTPQPDGGGSQEPPR